MKNKNKVVQEARIENWNKWGSWYDNSEKKTTLGINQWTVAIWLFESESPRPQIYDVHSPLLS